MTPFTFTPDGHEYRLGGRKIPGITTVLSGMGYYKGEEFFTEASRERGTRVHRAIYLVDEHAPEAGTLEEVLDTLELGEALHPYIEGWLLAKKELGFTSHRREFPACSRKLNIGCIPDSWGGFRGGATGVVELKTWKQPPVKCPRGAELQTAGQAVMIREDLSLESPRRYVVALPGNSSYRVYSCNNAADVSLVAYMAHVWWDRVNSGLLPWGGEAELEAAA